jgi:hypothetical protein
VDEDLVNLVWRLAKPDAFENLSFSDALRRALNATQSTATPAKGIELDPDALLAELAAMGDDEFREQHPNFEKPRRRVRAASPDPLQWLAQVPELAGKRQLRDWVSICRHLHIDVGGDSARRRLASWVATNRPQWPPVPDI